MFQSFIRRFLGEIRVLLCPTLWLVCAEKMYVFSRARMEILAPTPTIKNVLSQYDDGVHERPKPLHLQIESAESENQGAGHPTI